MKKEKKNIMGKWYLYSFNDYISTCSNIQS